MDCSVRSRPDVLKTRGARMGIAGWVEYTYDPRRLESLR